MMITVESVGIHRSVEAVFPPEELRDRLNRSGFHVFVVNDTLADYRALDALVTLDYEPEFLKAGCSWIHSIQSGVDRFPLTALEQHSLVLTSSKGIHRERVGEAVLGYLLAFSGGLHVSFRRQQEHDWSRPDWDELFTLSGEQLCIVGVGTLGKAIAERAAAMGMDVTGIKKTPEVVAPVDTVYSPEELGTAIDEARFVVLSVPLTEQTKELISNEELKRMPQDAYLVNVSRGEVVDTSALIDALSSGSIAGAAIDVATEEPLPPESPLWEPENLIITPHTAGVWRSYYNRVADLVERNIANLRNGQPIENRVV